jgi:hypothetical protein
LGNVTYLNLVWGGKFAAASIFVRRRAFWQQPELSAKRAAWQD